MLISLVHRAALKRNEKRDIFNFSAFLPSVEGPAALFHDDQTVVPLELKFIGFLQRHLHMTSTWQFWQILEFVMNNGLDSWNQSQVPTSPSSNACTAHAFRGESEREK